MKFVLYRCHEPLMLITVVFKLTIVLVQFLGVVNCVCVNLNNRSKNCNIVIPLDKPRFFEGKL